MNSRFVLATYVLGFLAVANKERPATSESIAGSLATNPVVVRRILSVLRKAGLVKTKLGTSGGAWLARDPNAISLLTIYQAIEGADGDLFSLSSLHPNPGCQVGPVVQEVLSQVLADAEAALHARLSELSLTQVVSQVMARVGCPPAEAATSVTASYKNGESS